MAYTDYYDAEEFNEAFRTVSLLNKSGIDSFYNLDNSGDTRYKVNRKGYLYFILGKYTTNLIKGEKANDYLKRHPYVLNYRFSNESMELLTSLGNVRFSLCVNGFEAIELLSNDLKIKKILCGVYAGKYATKCHEVSSLLGINYDYITTAFVNSPLRNYKYLHSFVEDGDYIFDFAKNLKMKKDDYYALLDSDIVSKIKGDQFVDDVLEASYNYPPMTPKDFLVRHDDLILRKYR